jgi:hypothetical protein
MKMRIKIPTSQETEYLVLLAAKSDIPGIDAKYLVDK